MPELLPTHRLAMPAFQVALGTPVVSEALSPGELMRSAANAYRVTEATTAAEVFLQDVATMEVRSCTTEYMLEALRQGVVSRVSGTIQLAPLVRPEQPKGDEAIIANIPEFMLSAAASKVLLAKHHWIKRLRRQGLRVFRPGPELTMALKEAEHSSKEVCPFGQDTLYRSWLTLRKYQGSVRSLLPKFHLRGGRGGHRLEPEVESIISNALEVVAGNKEKILRPSTVHDRVATLVGQFNLHRPAEESLRVPSVPTVTRRFNERFTAYEIAVRRFGKKRADRMFRENLPRVRATHALDVVQYDDTDTCVFLIDSRTGLPWGRCWLTAGVDEYSGMVVGKEMSEASRSSVSALGAIVNGIFQKNHSADEFADCKNQWEAFGHHGLIVLDNAPYNASETIELSVLEFESEIELARPFHPTDKPDIEGFNHLLKSGYVSKLAGWSGPKEDRELLEEGIGGAIMTMTDFARGLNRWILDDYSNKPRSTGRSPRELWRGSFAEHPPLVPRRQPSHELMLTEHRELTFRDSGGLLRNGLRYHSDELAVLRRRLGNGATVKVRTLPHNVGHLFVLDETTGHYLKVHCSETRYVAGMTEIQQSLIMKICRERKQKSPNMAEMQAARDALVDDTRRLSTSKKMIERKRAARAVKAGVDLTDGTKASAASKRAADKIVVMTELEDLMVRLGEVKLDEAVEY